MVRPLYCLTVLSDTVLFTGRRKKVAAIPIDHEALARARQKRLEEKEMLLLMKQMCTFMLFLLFLLFLAQQNRNPNAFLINNNLKNMLVNSKFSSVSEIANRSSWIFANVFVTKIVTLPNDYCTWYVYQLNRKFLHSLTACCLQTDKIIIWHYSYTPFFNWFRPMFHNYSATNSAVRHWAKPIIKLHHRLADLQNRLDASSSMVIVNSSLCNCITLGISCSANESLNSTIVPVCLARWRTFQNKCRIVLQMCFYTCTMLNFCSMTSPNPMPTICFADRPFALH